jgi:predicted site-specific integrase-resolvase
MKQARLQTAAEPETFLSKAELLQRLPISSATLNGWMRDQKIPFVKIQRRVLFNWENVREALLRHQKGGNQ